MKRLVWQSNRIPLKEINTLLKRANAMIRNPAHKGEVVQIDYNNIYAVMGTEVTKAALDVAAYRTKLEELEGKFILLNTLPKPVKKAVKPPNVYDKEVDVMIRSLMTATSKN